MIGTCEVEKVSEAESRDGFAYLSALVEFSLSSCKETILVSAVGVCRLRGGGVVVTDGNVFCWCQC